VKIDGIILAQSPQPDLVQIIIRCGDTGIAIEMPPADIESLGRYLIASSASGKPQ